MGGFTRLLACPLSFGRVLTGVRLGSPFWSIFLGGMLSMPNVDRLGSLIGRLELLDGGGMLQTSKLENLWKASNDFFSQ